MEGLLEHFMAFKPIEWFSYGTQVVQQALCIPEPYSTGGTHKTGLLTWNAPFTRGCRPCPLLGGAQCLLDAEYRQFVTLRP